MEKKSINIELRAVSESAEEVENKTRTFANFLNNYNLQNSNEKDFDANRFVIDSVDFIVRQYGFITAYQLCEISNTALDLACEIERTIRKEKENENKNAVA